MRRCGSPLASSPSSPQRKPFAAATWLSPRSTVLLMHACLHFLASHSWPDRRVVVICSAGNSRASGCRHCRATQTSKPSMTNRLVVGLLLCHRPTRQHSTWRHSRRPIAMARLYKLQQHDKLFLLDGSAFDAAAASAGSRQQRTVCCVCELFGVVHCGSSACKFTCWLSVTKCTARLNSFLAARWGDCLAVRGKWPPVWHTVECDTREIRVQMP